MIFIFPMNLALYRRKHLNFHIPVPFCENTLFMRETRIGEWSEEREIRMSVYFTNTCRIFEIKK